MRQRLSLGLVLVLLISARGDARRTVFNLANCNLSTVEAAVTSALDGDTINLPSCSVNWSSGIFVNKSITIQGTGMTSTVITSTMVPSGGTMPPMIDWQTKSTGNTPAGFTKLANLTLHGGSGGTGGSQIPLLRISGNSGKVVILGVNVTHTRTEGIRITGYVRGVYANGEIRHSGFFGVTARVEHESWGDHNGVGGTGCGGCGDKSWSEPSSMGTDQAWVWENNQIYDDTGLAGLAFLGDGWNGMRVVWRYNTIRNTQTGGHGTESGGRFRSMRHVEYYRNTGLMDAFIDGFFGTRGGTGMVFDNTLTSIGGGGANKIFSMSSYRSDPPDGSTPYWPFGRCGDTPLDSITRSGTTATVTTSGWDGRGHWLSGVAGLMPPVTIAGASDGLYNGTFTVTSIPNNNTFTYTMAGTPASNASGTLIMRMPYDGNTDATGYRCLDQVGAGVQASMMSGVVPNFGMAQALEPFYIWNNLKNGVLDPGVETNGFDVQTPDRDYYNQNTSFNGTSGMGRGTLAARPATCTTGVGYWATDQGEWDSTNGASPDGRLYKCTSTNTWTLHYTPLTYPHPLLGGGGGGPTDPVVLITAPTSDDHHDTTVQAISVMGTASDDGSVASIARTHNGGGSVACTGTTSWSCAAITQSVGVNTIVVTATDGTSDTGSDTILSQYLAANLTATDNFDRADWPTLGAWWTQQGAQQPYVISGNFATGIGNNFDCALWNQQSFTNDQYSQATVGFVADTTNAVRVSVRSSGFGALFNSYFLSTDGLSGAGHTFIGKFIDGALESILPIATTYNSTDVMKLEVSGSTLTAYKNGGIVGTVETGGQLASGSPGVCFYGAASSLNNWSGGDVGAAPPPQAPTHIRIRIRGL